MRRQHAQQAQDAQQAIAQHTGPIAAMRRLPDESAGWGRPERTERRQHIGEGYTL